ncbi:chloramphenicol acetyltransferase [Pedobacter zeae]|uniref:Chloramphenicol O-acetyltransferase type A n=1 Tax=Pedobacter zeae TaxID=1737356 RepID=A0A7W6K971_9SPHI|nr:chloramphenicol acetyltransferase [Pedobacter zeae]MBB4107531.1 chloramphenicol O-acetyltransferase type A [Pedobacter zeae]GGG98748.1 chloramphenicol acetyltransferase [Pedobacter zeae]
MKEKIDINNWIRKDHFNFFSTFEEPFFGVTVEVDCTATYQEAKENNLSFFLLYLHKSLLAVNRVEPFSYRIINGEVWKYDTVNAAATINRPNGTFGFGYLDFYEDFEDFKTEAGKEIEKVQATTGLIPSSSGENVIHYSALPWLNFTSLSHARNYAHHDSCPKISFGKVREEKGRKIMPLSIHVNHALMDGYHVGEFVETYQDLLSKKSLNPSFSPALK